MLFRETIAVYRENHTKHTNTLWAGHSSSTLKLVVHIEPLGFLSTVLQAIYYLTHVAFILCFI
jgi:hypothetical protein